MYLVTNRLLATLPRLLIPPERKFYGFVLHMFNRVDPERVKQVGPDRACAEWLLRNGAAIRWKGAEEVTRDYNTLPLTDDAVGGVFLIEDVDATDAAIASEGFAHFAGCNYIRKMILCHNHYLTDEAFPFLKALNKSLIFLEIKSCGDITEDGLKSLHHLINLKTLRLENLQRVKDPQKVTEELKSALSNCDVTYQS